MGNNDPAVSPYLKTWIAQDGVVVCGVTGEGTSKEIQANWSSPFEGEAVGSKFEKVGGLLQTGAVDFVPGVNLKNTTSITALQSRQVWGGNRPTQFSIVLQLYALENPQKEVIDALIALEKMASPDLKNTIPIDLKALVGMSNGNKLGRIPSPVIINIGRNAIYTDCVIESLSVPLDKEKNADGQLIRAEVNLQIQTMQMLNKSDVASTYR